MWTHLQKLFLGVGRSMVMPRVMLPDFHHSKKRLSLVCLMFIQVNVSTIHHLSAGYLGFTHTDVNIIEILFFSLIFIMILYAVTVIIAISVVEYPKYWYAPFMAFAVQYNDDCALCVAFTLIGLIKVCVVIILK